MAYYLLSKLISNETFAFAKVFPFSDCWISSKNVVEVVLTKNRSARDSSTPDDVGDVEIPFEA